MVRIGLVGGTLLELDLQAHLLALVLALHDQVLQLYLLMLELLGVVEDVSFWSGLVFALVRAHQLLLLLPEHFHCRMSVLLAAPRDFVAEL